MTCFTNIIMDYLEESRSKDKTISKVRDRLPAEQHKSETKDTVVDNLTSEVFRLWEMVDDTRSQLKAKTIMVEDLEREVKILQLKTEELELESRRSKDLVKDMIENMNAMQDNSKQ